MRATRLDRLMVRRRPLLTLPATAAIPPPEADRQPKIASAVSLAVERFTPKEALESTTAEVDPEASGPPPPCDVNMASIDEMEAEMRPLDELVRHQQMKERILELKAKVSAPDARHSDRASDTILRHQLTVGLGPQQTRPQVAYVPAISSESVAPWWTGRIDGAPGYRRNSHIGSSTDYWRDIRSLWPGSYDSAGPEVLAGSIGQTHPKPGIETQAAPVAAFQVATARDWEQQALEH
jgi:hypothetical protein